MSLLKLASRIVGKKASTAKEAVVALPRQDEGLPLGARIGGLLEIPRTTFMVTTGSLAKPPASSQMTIEAISRVRLKASENLKLYRLYTETGHSDSGAGQAFLQLFIQDGNVVEAAYYQHLFRVIPTTQEEQAAYQGNGYGLGESVYTMEDDQLSQCGCDAEALADALAGETELTFYRDTPDGEEPYVKPYRATEVRIDDAEGIKGLKQSMHMMPYRRQLPDGENTELLLIAFEVVESVNGIAAPSVQVDFMVGTPIEVQKIKVI